jgi:hypothetical protein
VVTKVYSFLRPSIYPELTLFTKSLMRGTTQKYKMTQTQELLKIRFISIFKSILVNPFNNKIFHLIFILGLVFYFIWLSVYAIIIVTTPVPVEYREGAILLTTDYILKGLNPYSLANQPLSMNVYGLGFNLVVLPFAAIFGNTLAIHRAISIIWLFLAGILVSTRLILRGSSKLFAA